MDTDKNIILFGVQPKTSGKDDLLTGKVNPDFYKLEKIKETTDFGRIKSSLEPITRQHKY